MFDNIFKRKKKKMLLSEEVLSTPETEREPFQFGRFFLFVLLFIASALFLSQPLLDQSSIPTEGEVAEQDHFAPQGFSYKDNFTAKEIWKKEFKSRPAPFLLDTQPFLASVEQLRRSVAAAYSDSLAGGRKREAVVSTVNTIIGRMARQGLLERTEPPERRLNILRGEDTYIVTAGEVVQPGDWHNDLKALPDADRAFLGRLIESTLRPSLRYDEDRAREILAEIKEEHPPTEITFEPQRPLIVAGQELTARDLDLLRQLRQFQAKRSLWSLFALLSFLAVTLLFGAVYTKRFQPNLYNRFRDVAAISFCFGAVLFITIFTQLLLDHTDIAGMRLSNAALPVATTAMALALVYGARTGFFVSMILAVLVSVVIAPRISLLVMFLFGSIVGAILASDDRKRSDLIKTGLSTGLIQAFVIIVIGLMHTTPASSMQIDVISAVLSGIVSAILAQIMIVPIEVISRRTSAFRLLELADLDHPFLQAMLRKSPGTFHHSQHVALLAQKAASETGRNALLAKVGSYFHDIGKIRKPEYFTENQKGDNPHDKLKPSLSAAIIRAHVTDGKKMAQEAGLPDAIIDFITQHHGTTSMSIFYHRALEASGEEGSVDQSDFQYPGPKPQSPETAIVMLADSVEAATRSLVKPSVARLQQTVKKIVIDKFAHGELDECDLTLKDLNMIADSFTETLSSMYHSRNIQYPGDKKTPKTPKPRND